MHLDCWREVTIPEALADYSTDQFGNRITGLSRLNAFIGPNNSGKSRLLRSLFLGVLEYTNGHCNQDAVIRGIQVLARFAPQLAADASFTKLQQFIDQARPLQMNQRGQVFNRSIMSNEHSYLLAWSRAITSQLTAEDRHLLQEACHEIRTNSPERHADLNEIKTARIYVPALRGLRHSSKDKTFYLDRTNRDYMKSGQHSGLDVEDPAKFQASSIFSGHELYELMLNNALGDAKQRKMNTTFAEFLSTRFFEGEEVELLPRRGSDVLYVRIGAAAERPVYELGDGIQHIIIMTLPLFLFPDRNLQLFIEEPELYLHPGYQRLLIEAFLDAPHRALQVFVATHSHQFMDITVDTDQCSIYKVSRNTSTEQFRLSRSSTSDFDTLRVLGVRNSSVLLSNCTIWVDGTTDRAYLRRYLELVQRGTAKPMREDIEFSFVEYNGNNITHWSFLDDDGIDVSRLCSPVYVLIDKDSPKRGGKKAMRPEKLSQRLGESATAVLPVREIENLLTPTVIARAVAELEGSEIDDKSFSQEDYVDAYLGEFIDSTILKGTPKRVGGYAAPSGTITNKTDFCKRAIVYINSVDDISPQALQVTQHILAFIRKHNS